MPQFDQRAFWGWVMNVDPAELEAAETRTAVRSLIAPLAVASSANLLRFLEVEWNELPLEALRPVGMPIAASGGAELLILQSGLCKVAHLFALHLGDEYSRKLEGRLMIAGAALQTAPLQEVHSIMSACWQQLGQCVQEIAFQAGQGVIDLKREVHDSFDAIVQTVRDSAAVWRFARVAQTGAPASHAPAGGRRHRSGVDPTPVPSRPGPGARAKELLSPRAFRLLKENNFHINAALGNLRGTPTGPWRVVTKEQRTSREFWKQNLPELDFAELQEAQAKAARGFE